MASKPFQRSFGGWFDISKDRNAHHGETLMELPWQLHPYHLLAAFIFTFRSFCWMMKKEW